MHVWGYFGAYRVYIYIYICVYNVYIYRGSLGVHKGMYAPGVDFEQVYVIVSPPSPLPSGPVVVWSGLGGLKENFEP